MKRVLITGMTGYIGSHLARRLLPEYEVFGLARAPVRGEYLADIKDQIKLLAYDGSYESVEVALRVCQPELVYHLAAYYTGGHGPKDTPALIQSNVVFGAYLLEAMAARGCRELIQASSVMTCYGEKVYNPLNLYAATKQAFSDLLAYYTDAGVLRAGTLMLSDTYGPGDHRPKILNLIKQAIHQQKPLALSDGRQDYDLVYIDDVTAAFELAGEQLLAGQWSNETFQVRSMHPLSLRETVEWLLLISGSSFQAGWGLRPSAEREIRKAIRLYPTLPGWQPKVSLEDGLRRFWEDG